MKIFVCSIAAILCYKVAAEPVRIGMPLGDSPIRQKLTEQLRLAYTALGFEPEFIALPSERRLKLLTDGLLDGDLFRICQLEDSYSELISVPIPLYTLQLNAYSLTPEKLVDWQLNADLLISHIHGFKMAEQQHFAGKRITVASDVQAFGLMLQGRVDLVLEDSDTAEQFLASQQAMPSVISQHVASFAVCHIIHHNLLGHLPALSKQLQQ